MKSTYKGKVYTNEVELFNDFSADHPEIYHDDVWDAIDFGGEVKDIDWDEDEEYVYSVVISMNEDGEGYWLSHASQGEFDDNALESVYGADEW